MRLIDESETYLDTFMPQDLSVDQIDFMAQDQLIPPDVFMPEDPFMSLPFLSEPYDLGASWGGQYFSFPNNSHEQHFHEQHLSHTMSTGSPFLSQVESTCLESGGNLSSYHPYDVNTQLAASVPQLRSTIHPQQTLDHFTDDQFDWVYDLTSQNAAQRLHLASNIGEALRTNEPTGDSVPTGTQNFGDLYAETALFQLPALECTSQTELSSFATEEPTGFPPPVLSVVSTSEPEEGLAARSHLEEPMDLMEVSQIQPKVFSTTRIHYEGPGAHGKSDCVQGPPQRVLFGPSRPVSLPKARRGGRKGPLTAQEKSARREIRKRGSCIRCRKSKEKVRIPPLINRSDYTIE